MIQMVSINNFIREESDEDDLSLNGRLNSSNQEGGGPQDTNDLRV